MSINKVAVFGGEENSFLSKCRKISESWKFRNVVWGNQGVVDEYGLEGEVIGEVAAGSGLEKKRDFSLAREALLAAKLSPMTNAFDVQKACGTSLEAAVNLGNKIALGQIDSAIAAGVDTSSDVPIELKDRFSQKLVQLSKCRTIGQETQSD